MTESEKNAVAAIEALSNVREVMTKYESMAISAIGALTKAGELLPEDVTADDIRCGIERLKKRVPRFSLQECDAFAQACRTMADDCDDPDRAEFWTYMAERASDERPPPRFGSGIWLRAYHDALMAEGFAEPAAEAWNTGLDFGIVRGDAPEYFTTEELRERMRNDWRERAEEKEVSP